MKEALEKIKKELRAKKDNLAHNLQLFREHGNERQVSFCETKLDTYVDALSIVSEVEAEYGNPKTNSDRIRSMSDSELAWFLCGVFDDDECDGKYICGETIPHYDEDKIVEWLKSEVTE